MRKSVQKELGFTMIELMVGVGLLLVIVLAMFTLMVDFGKTNRMAMQRSSLVAIRTDLINSILRQDTWIITYQNNSNMNTLKTGTYANTSAWNNLDLYRRKDRSGAGTIVYAQTEYFNDRGERCLVPPEASCALGAKYPVRVQLDWQMVDIGGGTVTPTGYFPYGQYDTGYFSNSVYDENMPYASWGTSGYAGYLPALIRVRGSFTFYTVGNKQYNRERQDDVNNFNFLLYKEVP